MEDFMYKKVDVDDVIESYFAVLNGCKDPVRRKDALAVLYFMESSCDEKSQDYRKLSHRVAEALTTALTKDSDAEVRLFAAILLFPIDYWDSEKEMITAALIQGTKDEDYRVRIEAINHLGPYGKGEEFLVRALADRNIEVRIHAALAVADTWGLDCEDEDSDELISRLNNFIEADSFKRF
jgi:hypothetical protein